MFISGFMSRHFSFLMLIVIVTLLTACSNETEQREQNTCDYKSFTVDEFSDTLSVKVVDYISDRVTQTIETKTNVFSTNIFRMVYDSVIEDDSTRVAKWEESFEKSGLSSDSIQAYVNNEINIYNSSHEEKINPVNLISIKKRSIIDDVALEKVKKTEWMASFDLVEVIWFIIPKVNFLLFLFFYVVIIPLFCIGFIFGFVVVQPIVRLLNIPEQDFREFMSSLKPIFNIFLAVTFFLVIMLFSMKYSYELESEVISNYMKYILSQDIPNQILGTL